MHSTVYPVETNPMGVLPIKTRQGAYLGTIYGVTYGLGLLLKSYDILCLGLALGGAF